jgi:hypothetical protein
MENTSFALQRQVTIDVINVGWCSCKGPERPGESVCFEEGT